MKKIVIVSPVHQNNDIRVYKKQTISLINSGLKVTLIARRNNVEEVLDNRVDFVEVEKPTNRITRFFSLFGLMLTIFRIKGDIYLLHNPDTIPIGIVLSILGKKVVYDTHEDFEERILTRKWIPKITRKPIAFIVSNFERFSARYIFNHSICTQQKVVNRLGINSTLIGNPPILVDKANFLHSSSVDKNLFNLCYIGSISNTRGIIEIVKAIDKIDDVFLHLIGPCSDDTITLCSSFKGWKKVAYYGELEQCNAFSIVKSCDLGLITILDKGDHKYTYPNKLFEYMALGIPFIASDFITWRELTANSNAGFFIEPSVNGIVTCLNHIISDRGQLEVLSTNASNYVKNVNWDVEGSKFIKVIEDVINNG